ncbi:MAG: DUF3592 domain-containing protein [Clostridia bacterium]|nr:DUF3592 domain-containing protein [Clostridia bacterium]
MNFENKFARFMRNSGPARFFVPAGLVFILAGVLLLCFASGDYLETSGVVTKVTESEGYDTEGHPETLYDIEFTYKTADGSEYSSSFPGMNEKRSVGDKIKVFYDSKEPEKTSNTKSGKIVAIAAFALGAAALAYGVYATVKAFKKSKSLGSASFPSAAFDNYRENPGVKEYYVRFDGHGLKPGYIIEDAERNVLFEGKMLKNALVGARTYEFNDHLNGKVTRHEVGHTVTQRYNDEFFSAKSWFKFDGKNVWDLLHEKGFRINNNARSKFPYMVYEIAKDGTAFALLESSGMYVHEDEAEQHKFNVPTGSHFYRVWTATGDLHSLFLNIFAISETEQTFVE